MNSTNENTPLEKEFFSAVKQGKLDLVRSLHARKEELLKAYDYNEFGAPCLNLACGHRNNRPMAELLLELGADPNQESDWEAGPWSPAVSAAENGDQDLARYLVSKGAAMTIHLASLLGEKEILEQLLKTDPTLLHARGGDGCTALHFATTPEVADCLLQHGANLEARCIDHESTPVQWIAKRTPHVARHLFRCGAKPDIFSACLAGDTATVRMLVTDNPELLTYRMTPEFFPHQNNAGTQNILTFKVGYNATPLHAAAIGNHPEIITLLVSSGLDVNIRGAYDDCTALHLAAWDDTLEAAKTLLDCGADLECKSGNLHENTPLGWAIVAGSTQVATELLSRACVIHDYYISDTEHGIKGGFQEFKATPRENYESILAMLKEKE